MQSSAKQLLNSAKKKHFLNSSEISILEYLENILGRCGTSTTFKRLAFPTVLSE